MSHAYEQLSYFYPHGLGYAIGKEDSIHPSRSVDGILTAVFAIGQIMGPRPSERSLSHETSIEAEVALALGIASILVVGAAIFLLMIILFGAERSRRRHEVR